MAVSLPDDHKVRFYGSAGSEAMGAAERVRAGGSNGRPVGMPGRCSNCPWRATRRSTRWVLKVGLNPGGLQGGSGEQYFVGGFDGTRFVNDNPADAHPLDRLRQGLLLRADVQRIFPRRDTPVMIGWMNNWQYAAKVPTQSMARADDDTKAART